MPSSLLSVWTVASASVYKIAVCWIIIHYKKYSCIVYIMLPFTILHVLKAGNRFLKHVACLFVLCGSHTDCTLITEWGPPHNWIIYMIVCLITCLLFCFICWEQEVLCMSFKCSWNYCRWGCYKLLNFPNLYVQVEALKWITVYHVHHRADIFSKYLTRLHSVVSCLLKVFLCCDFKHGFVTLWLRKCYSIEDCCKLL
jgi:hypothetical protein